MYIGRKSTRSSWRTMWNHSQSLSLGQHLFLTLILLEYFVGILHAQVAAGLTDDEVAEALAERSQRIYDKYGTMMLNTEGFSASGLERKATCKSLFQKMQYLTEHEPLIKPGTEAAGKVNLRTVGYEPAGFYACMNPPLKLHNGSTGCSRV